MHDQHRETHDACEQGVGSPPSCLSKYDKASAAMLAKPGCPTTCLGASAQADLADAMMSYLEVNNGQVYCDGTAPLGGDDPGFVPSTKAANKCEDAVEKMRGKLAACIVKCRTKLADAIFKGKMFDVQACEQGLGKPASCRALYDKSSAVLLGKPGCPSCLQAAAQSAIADGVIDFVHQNRGLIYCAGTTLLP